MIDQIKTDTVKLSCEMRKECQAEVTHLDEKGYIYCKDHGETRKYSMRCRKLKPSELKQLEAGQQVSKY